MNRISDIFCTNFWLKSLFGSSQFLAQCLAQVTLWLFWTEKCWVLLAVFSTPQVFSSRRRKGQERGRGGREETHEKTGLPQLTGLRVSAVGRQNQAVLGAEKVDGAFLIRPPL